MSSASTAKSNRSPPGAAFPPEKVEELQEFIHQPPPQNGASGSRWTLAELLEQCSLLEGLSCLSAVHQRLRRCRIRLKRGRLHISSPDPEYDQKVAQGKLYLAAARAGELVYLYGDEFTYYRQPLAGWDYAVQGAGGAAQPTALCLPPKNTKRRVCGLLDAADGRLLHRSLSRFGVAEWCAFLPAVRARYGPDVRIVIQLDNWPVHHHEQVKAAAAAERLELHYQPTYAPWTNPIEKLWRWLKQAELYHHRLAGDWEQLKQRVDGFLEHVSNVPDELLWYVGLGRTV
jgi:DDE superfamily endonuclease